jgi:hypothetical protein
MKTITAYSENHMKLINIPCGKIPELMNVTEGGKGKVVPVLN